jgi:general secretion pathway protein J
MSTRSGTHGFTLIELMVAIFITAMLLAMGYGAVNQAFANHAALDARQERLLAVQTTMRLFTQDLTQLTPRPVRQPLGDGWLPALAGAPGDPATTGSNGANAIVTLTRAGWANPAGIQRPALQRVAYILEKGTLRREHWPVLDATMTTTTVRRELLDKVKSVTLRYMDVSFNWRDQWPPQALAGDPNANLRLRPIAVEVTLELEDWGTIVRVIEVAA